ncbi:MAG: hypothetical protein LBR30_03070 [Clostridioides sp.]|jgi:hypothetical protein|nr:hypothetical protein [Clostridioides sp.]
MSRKNNKKQKSNKIGRKICKKYYTKNNYNAFVNFIEKNKDIIISIVSLVYGVIYYCYKRNYQINCQNFYGIPSIYFNYNINDKLIYLALIIFLVFILINPMRKVESINKSDKLSNINLRIFFSILFGVIISLVNSVNFIEIVKQIDENHLYFERLNKEPSKIWLILIILTTIETLITSTLRMNLSNIKKESTWKKHIPLLSKFVIYFAFNIAIMVFGFEPIINFSIKHSEIIIQIIVWSIILMPIITMVGINFLNSKIESVWKKIVRPFFIFCFISTISIMVIGATLTLYKSVKDKTNYEFVTIENEHYVVLSHVEEKILIVPYKVDKVNKVEKYTYYTGEYELKNIEDAIFEYRDIKSSPSICRCRVQQEQQEQCRCQVKQEQ